MTPVDKYIKRVTPEGVKPIIQWLDKALTEEERYFFPCTEKELQAIMDSDTDVAYVVLSVEDQSIMACGHMRTFNGKYDIPALGVAIGKDFRGQGIGEALCRCMLNIAKVVGYKEALLKVNIINPKAANLYKKLGFEEYQRDTVHIWMKVNLQEKQF